MNHEIQLDAARPVIFAADVHLKPQWSVTLPAVTEDSRTGLSEYLRVIEETNACAIILGGDIFDQNYVRHLWVQQLFFEWVDEVVARDCDVLAFTGNHDDVLHQLDPANPVHIHSIHPQVIDIDGRIFSHGDRRYGCIAHCSYPEELYKRIDAIGDEFDTLLLHQLTTQFGGSTNLNDLPEHIRTILLGDVHAFADGTTQNGAWWGYPGAMFPQNTAEHEHGVFIVESDPLCIPLRKSIVARATRKVEVSAAGDIDTQLTIAAAWVKDRRQEIIKASSNCNCKHLEAIMRPVVYFLVERELISDMKKAIAHNEIGDDAHVVVKPTVPVKHLDVDVGEVTKTVPTPIDLLPEFVKRFGDGSTDCPYPEASTALARELLLSGGAGRKAGDDEKRADGKPLAHKAIIAAALADVGVDQ